MWNCRKARNHTIYCAQKIKVDRYQTVIVQCEQQTTLKKGHFIVNQKNFKLGLVFFEDLRYLIREK